jgi:hypothetical protein
MRFVVDSLNVLGHDYEICDEHKQERHHREAAQGIEQKELEKSKQRQRCAPESQLAACGLIKTDDKHRIIPWAWRQGRAWPAGRKMKVKKAENWKGT